MTESFIFSKELLETASTILDRLSTSGKTLGTAESCTAGFISGTFACIAGSSSVLKCGFVTYCNEAKISMLGVNPETIRNHTEVSAETAKEMAEGVLRHAPDGVPLDIGISVTGIAGPGGASPGKPVGLVWFGLAQKSQETVVEKVVFPGNRNEIRMGAVAHALQMILRVA